MNHFINFSLIYIFDLRLLPVLYIGMAFRVAEIYFNDSNSQVNKDLTEFLKRRIELINTRGHIKVKCIIAGVKDHAQLRQRGLKPLPAMIISGSNQPVTTVPKIIEVLSNIVKSSRKVAAPKNEDEVLSDYFSKTLGPIRQNDEGRIVVPDEPEEMDNGDNLVDAFHRELTRRGQNNIEVDPTQGQTGKKPKKNQADRRPPPKPSRNVERDNDEEDRAPPVVQYPGHMPRHDNVATDDAGDPLRALNRLNGNRQSAGGEAGMDDQMMSILLAKMSDEQ